MRLVPLITAVLVSTFLYLAVFERDALLAFARGNLAGDAVAQETETPSETEAAADNVMNQGDNSADGELPLKTEPDIDQNSKNGGNDRDDT